MTGVAMRTGIGVSPDRLAGRVRARGGIAHAAQPSRHLHAGDQPADQGLALTLNADGVTLADIKTRPCKGEGQ